MSFVLELAQGALKATTGLPDLNSKNSVGSLQGRVVTHWTFYMFMAGSAVGLVTTVVASVFQSWGLVILGGVLCATNVVGTIYASMLGPIPALEDETKRLGKQVATLNDDIKQLNIANDDLKGIQKKANEMEEEYKTSIKTGEKLLSDKVKEIQKVTTQLNEASEKVKKLETIVKDIGKQTEVFSKETIKLQEENGLLSKNVDKMSVENITLKKSSSKWELDIHEFDKKTDDYEKYSRETSKQLELWKSTFNQMKDIYIQNKNELNQVKEHTKKLEPIVANALRSSKLSEESNQELKQQNAMLLSKLGELKELKNYLNHKTSFEIYMKNEKEFSEWHNSKNKGLTQ